MAKERARSSDLDSFQKIRIERAKIYRIRKTNKIDEEEAKTLLRILHGVEKSLSREIEHKPPPEIQIITTLSGTVEDALREIKGRLDGDKAFRDRLIALLRPYLANQRTPP